MSTFLIPLRGIAESFEISLAGKAYLLTVKWNDGFEGGWVFDLADATTDEVLVACIPFTTGTDLLSGLGYLGIEGELIVYTDGDETAVPTISNLGTESNLYFLTDVASNG